MSLVHTPFDGSSNPFTIGLKPLDLADWIEVDATFAFQMGEKRRLYAERRDEVFVAEPGTESAQQEVLDLIVAHLAARFPDRSRDVDPTRPPLLSASLLVQEDLILMRRGEESWRLAAGSLCFPSSWSLREKFTRPMSAIHEPVPGFGPGTRNAGLIDRMFDKLQVGHPVQRWNWSLQAGDALFMPLTNTGRVERAARPPRFPGADALAAAFIRVERQTLRKLPASGDILFTIRIHLDPLALLRAHPEGARLAQSFADQLEGLDREQLDYKGLAADRDRLVSSLREIA